MNHLVNERSKLYLALCKLPLLHSQWFAHFWFSEIVCDVIIVLTAAFECLQGPEL